MINGKTTINLLAAANQVLTTTIIPNLPITDRRNSELIQRALEIAICDLTIKSQDTAVSKKKKIHEKHKNESVATLKSDHAVLLRNNIRLGMFDNDLLGPIADHLELTIVKRLKISNPKYLLNAKYSYPVAD